MRIVRSGLVGTLLACTVVLLAPAGASAAIGEITFDACVEDLGLPNTGCTAENQGLLGASSVAVSPDGRSVYVSGGNEDIVSIFSRNTSTGALTPAGCISDADIFPGSGCADFAEGLNAPAGIAIAPSGLDVYVAGNNDQAIVHLARDPNTGDLSDGGCVPFTGDSAGCGTTTQPGIERPWDLVVSPDGASVYVVSSFFGGSVARLTRNTSTGDISASGQCIADAGGTPAGCGGTQEGLAGARAMAISADGASLHVVSRDDGSLVSLKPDLSSLGCFADVGAPLAGCTSVEGLSGGGPGMGVAVSPDGGSVYTKVADGGAGVVVQFDRSAAGALTHVGCIQDTGASTGCAQSAQGLAGDGDIAVSSDNASVYAVSDVDDAIVRFDRNTTTGALTPLGCIADAGTTGCASLAPALDQSRGVTVSPDSRSVYQTSQGDSAITHYTRESNVVTPPPATGEIRLDAGKAKCKGSCKKIKVKVTVDKPGVVQFCNAPAGVNAPCGIAGQGPTAPRPVLAKKAPKLIVDKELDVAEAGTVTTSLKLTKKARKTIAKKGKLSIKLQVDFTPTGGELASDRSTLKVKGKKKKKKK